MRFQFIAAEKAHFPVRVLCQVLQVARGGFYAWCRRGPSQRTTTDAQLAVAITASHRASRGTYGSPRVHRDLREQGRRHGRKRVARIMREQQIVARQKRRFRRTTDSRHAFPIAPNRLNRQFAPAKPDQVWAADVTYVATLEGWAYLAVILDLFSRRVVGWAVSATNDRALALEALLHALRGRRPRAGLLHHSDRGSPYASEEYRKILRAHRTVRSMSRRGDCWDNAVVESFFATLRAELLDHEQYATRAAAIASIGDYIDGFYNVRRRHSFLGYVSPLEFEVRAHRWHGAPSTRNPRRSPGVAQKPTSPNGSRALPRRGAATSVSPRNGRVKQSRPQARRDHEGDSPEANPNVHA